MGRELGQIGLVSEVRFFCQQLTAYAYLGLTFGTISGTGVVFLAPNLALKTLHHYDNKKDRVDNYEDLRDLQCIAASGSVNFEYDLLSPMRHQLKLHLLKTGMAESCKKLYLLVL
jgi:hypothetical protein